MRQWIRTQRDHLVRVELEQRGYILDYWMVYRVELLAPATRTRSTVLRSAARGSSRRLHAERAARAVL